MIVPRSGTNRIWGIMDRRGLDFAFGQEWQAAGAEKGVFEPPWGDARTRREQQREWDRRKLERMHDNARKGASSAQEDREFEAWGPSVHRVVGRTSEREEDPWEGRWFWVPEMVAAEHRWWRRFMRLVKAVRPEIPEPRVEEGFTKQAVFHPEGQTAPRDVWTYKGYPWSWLHVVTGEERRVARMVPRDSMKTV